MSSEWRDRTEADAETQGRAVPQNRTRERTKVFQKSKSRNNGMSCRKMKRSSHGAPEKRDHNISGSKGHGERER
jgi:hypothetical protein